MSAGLVECGVDEKSFCRTKGLYEIPGGENVLKHHNKFMKRNLDQVYSLFLGDTKKENKHKTIS